MERTQSSAVRAAIVATIAVALLVILTVACSRARPTAKSPGGPTPTTAASQSASAPGSQATGRDVLAELRQASVNLRGAKYRAVYDFRGTADLGESTGTVVLASMPPRHLYRIEGTSGGKTSAIVIIDDGTASYLCTDTGTKVCVRKQSANGLGEGVPPGVNIGAIVEKLAGSDPSTISGTAGQEIAGRKGQCYAVNGAQAGTGLLCISPDDGLLLLLDGTFGGARVTLRAREVSTNPPDSDFAPPYAVANGSDN